MPSPFPGMNPYLEHPRLWPGVHHLLISEILRTLAPQLRPKYIVEIEERIYRIDAEETLLVGIPDVTIQRPLTATTTEESNVAVAAPPAQAVTVTIPMPETIRERYLEVREVATGEVVTAIEVLSPKNKRSGEGLRAYLLKRRRVLGSLTHLVEIDLLRDGKPLPIISNDIKSNYRILVSKSDRRPQADLYAFNLQNPIPFFSLPLDLEDVEPLVDLQTLLNGIYDLASYDLRIDYSREPERSLSETDAVWTDGLLREQGLR